MLHNFLILIFLGGQLGQLVIGLTYLEIRQTSYDYKSPIQDFLKYIFQLNEKMGATCQVPWPFACRMSTQMSIMFPSGLKIYGVFISDMICTSHLGQIVGQTFMKNQTSRYKHHHGAESGEFHPVKCFSQVLKMMTRKLRATCSSNPPAQVTI